MFGGGRKGILNYQNEYLTLEMHLLFENEYLDIMSLLCLLYEAKRKKNGVNINELIFGFTLVTSEANIEIDEADKILIDYSMCKFDLDIEYIKCIEQIKRYLEILLGRGVIDIHNIGERIGYQINSEGIKVIEQLKCEYFSEILNKYKIVYKYLKCTKKNIVDIMGVKI